MEAFCANLWMILNCILGTKEQVLIRRRYFGLYHKLSKILTICSGSRAEGLDMEGSDYDTIFLEYSFSIEPDRKDHENDIIIETENIKPGFVRIRCGKNNRFYKIFKSLMVQTNDGLFISSLFFRDYFVDAFKQENPSAVPHGPCTSTVNAIDGFESDLLVCLPCKTWPALEWRCRTRNRGWPSQILVQKIIEEGCLLVPIGNPCSPHAFIEWRISFSLAEKRLVHSFNHTQLLCYGLLKLYLKHVINSNAEVKDMLCSYFLKTSLFYCIEEENISWCKENIFDCFWTCFTRLLKWVEQGYCPNYFIKENNMIEGKIYGSSQRILFQYLRELYAEGHESLRRIPCLLENVFDNSERVIPREIEMRVKEYLCDASLFFVMFSSIENETRVNVISGEACNVDKVILQYWYNCSVVSQIQQFYKDTLGSMPNKTRYKKIKGLKCYIKHKNVNIDKCTRMLILATLCYLNGEYKDVISVVEEVLKIHGRFMSMLRNPQTYMDEICGRGFTLQQKIDLGLFTNVFVCIRAWGFYPQEMESELLGWEDETDKISVPAVPYSNVLLVLSHYHLKQTQKMNIALNKFYLAVHGESFCKSDKCLAISLLNKCMDVTKSHQENL